MLNGIQWQQNIHLREQIRELEKLKGPKQGSDTSDRERELTREVNLLNKTLKDAETDVGTSEL